MKNKKQNLIDNIKWAKENMFVNITITIAMKSYQHDSHFACRFFPPIVTGVFISKRVYYLYNVMLYARKKKKKESMPHYFQSHLFLHLTFKKMKTH